MPVGVWGRRGSVCILWCRRGGLVRHVCLSVFYYYAGAFVGFLNSMDVSDASSRRAVNSDLLRLGR